jgi:putative tryptophan/tyrosine transport system substrate-binding protein
MRRRDFITVLAGATAWMSAVCAEEPRHVVGLLSAFESPNEIPGAGGLASFYQGLKETGFIKGRNISIEPRWADGHYDRLPSLAAELVARKVSVIVADGVPSAFAAKAATKTIPIVFMSGADPVKLDLVESLSRPNSNLTGVSIFSNALGPKDVELLHELLPAVSAIALLGNPNNANFQSAMPDVRAAADALSQHLEVLTASTESGLEAVFATMVQHRVGALIVMADPFLIARRRQLVELAARHAMAAIYPDRMFVDLGGLMSYGSSVLDLQRQVGIYVGKILKGAKPAELPIQQSTKVELAINLKTAKALGLIVPPQLLARADEVIE